MRSNRNVLEVLSCNLGEGASQTRVGRLPSQQAPGLGCGRRTRLQPPACGSAESPPWEGLGWIFP